LCDTSATYSKSDNFYTHGVPYSYKWKHEVSPIINDKKKYNIFSSSYGFSKSSIHFGETRSSNHPMFGSVKLMQVTFKEPSCTAQNINDFFPSAATVTTTVKRFESLTKYLVLKFPEIDNDY
jgi:hypothetical protein